jgi:hypothetical protein
MKAKLALIAAMTLLPFLGMSQTIDDEISLLQAEFGMEKRALVEQYMDLSDQEAQAFWPVFQKYEDERRIIAKERLKLINDYLEKFETINETEIDAMVKRRLKADASMSKLHSKYYGQFKKATNATTAAKFLQLDDYIQTTLFLALLDGLPFLGEK